MSYTCFAAYYDKLTDNVNYTRRADYIHKILNDNHIRSGILLDLACGTGSMSFEMEKRGYDVIGVDASPDMLGVAAMKKSELQSGVLFLNQDMRSIDLYGTVKASICMMDSINHLQSIEDVESAFAGVSLFTEPGGIFIFDVNTRYKHKNILGNNAFVFEDEQTFTVWQNEYNPDNASVDIYLDFFTAENYLYSRESESFTEYYYSDEVLKDALNKCGFSILHIYDDLAFQPPKSECERKVFICKKER